MFARDPVNLIRMFRLAQKHNLVLHPDAMRVANKSLKLIDSKLRHDPEANRLFLEILTSHDAEIILRRMNETGVLGRFVRAFGRVVAMMQFNMYHHYTVDEHLLRCIGVLAEIERGSNEEYTLANDLMRKILPEHRTLLYVALFLHDIAKGRIEDHSIAGARIARAFCPRLGLSAADTDTVAWLVEQHLVMSTVAQSRDLSDRKTIENFAAVVQSLERMKLLTILTTADIRAVGPGVWNGWKAQLLRTLYYETEPVLTGGFSEVNRAQRVAMAQAEFRAELKDWPAERIDAYIARHYPAYWLKVDLPHRVVHARFVQAAEDAGKSIATTFALDATRGVTELTILAPDHPWLLSTLAGACAATGANIVDAQIFTTTDGRALDTIAVSREFEQDDDETRRAARIADTIEKALSGTLKLPEVVARRSASKGRLKAFAIEPEVTINNQWSNRYTVIEVTGLDRPGLLYELTATLSKLSLNITSAHVATFGERVVDVFYVTDLLGAKIASPTREMAIKRSLLQLFAPAGAASRSQSRARRARRSKTFGEIKAALAGAQRQLLLLTLYLKMAGSTESLGLPAITRKRCWRLTVQHASPDAFESCRNHARMRTGARCGCIRRRFHADAKVARARSRKRLPLALLLFALLGLLGRLCRRRSLGRRGVRIERIASRTLWVFMFRL